MRVRFAVLAIQAVACCLALGPMASSAAPAAPPPVMNPAMQDDPAKVAAAREFIILYHPRMDPKKIAVMVDKTMARDVANAKRLNPKLDAKKYEKERRAMMMNGAESSLNRQARVVSRHFTLPELKSLVAFFSSPLGLKLAGETPKIMREMVVEKVRDRGDSAGISSITVSPSNAAPDKPKK